MNIVDINIESIVFYILLIDAVGANILAWSNGQRWWQKNLQIISRNFPMARGWTTYYLVVVIIMGIMLHKNDILVLPW